MKRSLWRLRHARDWSVRETTICERRSTLSHRKRHTRAWFGSLMMMFIVRATTWGFRTRQYACESCFNKHVCSDDARVSLFTHEVFTSRIRHAIIGLHEMCSQKKTHCYVIEREYFINSQCDCFVRADAQVEWTHRYVIIMYMVFKNGVATQWLVMVQRNEQCDATK